MSKEREQSTEAAVREIRRRTRRKFSPEFDLLFGVADVPGANRSLQLGQTSRKRLLKVLAVVGHGSRAQVTKRLPSDLSTRVNKSRSPEWLVWLGRASHPPREWSAADRPPLCIPSAAFGLLDGLS
jgi:hypothetical protein